MKQPHFNPLFGETPPSPAVRPQPTTEIWKRTMTVTNCRSPRCTKPIVKAVIVSTGNIMLFEYPLVVLGEYDAEDATKGPILHVELRGHWATCPDAHRFGTRRRG